MSASETGNGDEEAIEMLKQLGLKEYEARCFVALSRVEDATAKEISEVSDVPRTRVYDATRVLEAQGLIEVHHGSPQQFRAVSVDEAIDTLRGRFESRFNTLRTTLEGLDRQGIDSEDDEHQVWSLSGSEAVANRNRKLIEEATDEIVAVLGVETLVEEDLLDALNAATDRGVSVVVGTLTEEMRDRIDDAVEGAEVFVTELEWLRDGGPLDRKESTAIGRLLLVDRSTILVSSYEPSTGKERAVFGRGFGNGLVIVVRRMLASGLPSIVDPGSSTVERTEEPGSPG